MKAHTATDLSSPANSAELEFFSRQKWIGKRLSIDLLANKETKFSSEDAFFDYSSIGSDNYYEYPEWEQLVTKEYGLSNVCQRTLSNFVSLQVADACNDTNSAFIIPHKKDVRSQIRPLDLHLVHKLKDRANYSLNWEKDYSVQGSENQIVYAGENAKVHETTKYVANLLNFKWELKKTFSAKQRLELLHSLSLTDKLIEAHLGKQPNTKPDHAHFAPRTPAKFFEYLSSKNPSSLYC